jgi:acetyltransferase-like isoleucine patch superfamily enzyme
MVNAYRFLAMSDAPAARGVRAVYRALQRCGVPAPKPLVLPALWTFLAIRSLYYLGMRMFVCEPLFKAYCARHGKRLRTGVFVHWVEGAGDIVVGDDVWIDGKCSFTFAARFSERPTLVIGDGTGIGHNCSFTVAKQISIGRHCRIANDVWMFDSSGHPTDPEARLAGRPPAIEDVRPIRLGDNVWIGRGATIFPGVEIGDGSVVCAGAVVMSLVPSRTLVGGNPARALSVLKPGSPRPGSPRANGERRHV